MGERGGARESLRLVCFLGENRRPGGGEGTFQVVLLLRRDRRPNGPRGQENVSE